VSTKTASGSTAIFVRRVVIATGHDGGGVWAVPDMVSDGLLPQVYTHSNVPIDFARLTGRRVGILGHGGSAFDAGLAAPQAGAASVDLCFRCPRLPVVNPHR
jgi:cation diffusion facilitator CzcD-associated flavoprotein CzcO